LFQLRAPKRQRITYKTNIDTFNNISAISWLSVLFVEETGGPGENHRVVTDKLDHITEQ
jgi:hypothetical protein